MPNLVAVQCQHSLVAIVAIVPAAIGSTPTAHTSTHQTASTAGGCGVRKGKISLAGMTKVPFDPSLDFRNPMACPFLGPSSWHIRNCAGDVHKLHTYSPSACLPDPGLLCHRFCCWRHPNGRYNSSPSLVPGRWHPPRGRCVAKAEEDQCMAHSHSHMRTGWLLEWRKRDVADILFGHFH